MVERGAAKGTGAAILAEGGPPHMLLIALVGKAEPGVGKDCCCEENPLSGTKEDICQGWFEASEGLEMEAAAGAEKARVTEGGGFLDTNGGAPEAKEAVILASPTTNCLIFSLALALKASSSRAEASDAKDGRMVG